MPQLSTNRVNAVLESRTISASWVRSMSIDARAASVIHVQLGVTMAATSSVFIRFDYSHDGVTWAPALTTNAAAVTANGEARQPMLIDVRNIAATAFTHTGHVNIRYEVRSPFIAVSHQIGTGSTAASLISIAVYAAGQF